MTVLGRPASSAGFDAGRRFLATAQFSRLDVPVVFGSLQDRWFAVLKPPGFVAHALPGHPSVEGVLQPFCGDRRLSFPIRPEEDVQGLCIVVTDDAMRSCFQDLLRRGLVHATYRVLADVSPATMSTLSSPPLGLPFTDCDRLTVGSMLGSLRAPGGVQLLRHGQLQSRLGLRPLRLRMEPSGQVLAQTVRGTAAGSKSSSSGRSKHAMTAWSSAKELLTALEGEGVPPLLRARLSQNSAEHSRSWQSVLRPTSTGKLVTTEFELVSGPVPCPTNASLHTAIYLARASKSASHQVRIHFADAGCPVLFDPWYHPQYSWKSRRHAFRVARIDEEARAMPLVQGNLGVQLCTVDLPDPFRPDEALRLSLRAAPAEWRSFHPSPDFPGSSLDEGDDHFLG